MAAKVKFSPGAATLTAADGRREARGEFTGWQTRSARPLRRADGIFLSSNPFPMKPPDYIHSNRCNLCAAAFMIGEQMAEVKRERREKKYSGVMNECSVSEWVGWKKAGIIVARVLTKKRMWTQMKNVYGASCVVDVEAKIDINRPTGVYYICMRKKWICPNVQMSINNTAGGRWHHLTSGSCGLLFSASYRRSENGFNANKSLSGLVFVFNCTFFLFL